MNSIHVILALYATQQCFFAVVWLALAGMRMSRRAAAHWSVATMFMALGLAVVLARPWLPQALGLALPNLLYLVACALIARGVRIFVRRPGADRQAMLVVVGASGVVAAVAAAGLPFAWMVIGGGAGMGWMLLRAANDMRCGLAAEAGRPLALLCSLPFWMTGGLLVTRSLLTAIGVEGSGAPLDAGATHQVVVTLFLVMFTMLMHFAMGGMLLLRLVNRLRHLSQHDVLTKLLNRRAFAQRLATERERQRRAPAPVAPLALLALDLDHFKAVNDRWGHTAGDAVLVATAALLQREARAADTVARMGGEEFALLLPGTDFAGARQLAERLLDVLRREVIAVDGQPVRVTASIGVAVSIDPDASEVELWRQADRALYLAKGGGRDRVVCAGGSGALSGIGVAGALPRRAA